MKIVFVNFLFLLINFYAIAQTELHILSETATNISCHDLNDARISVNVAGGTAPYTYKLNDGVYQASNSFGNLAAGTYTISVKDADNEVVTSETSHQITNPDLLEILTVEITNITCFGLHNGQVKINAQGGTGQLEYKLNESPYQNNPTFINLLIDKYIPAVRDENQCKAATTAVYIIEPPEIIITPRYADVNCFGESSGYIHLEAYGGTGNLKYSIDYGQNYYENAGIFDGLPIGSYPILLKDDNTCLKAAGTVLITQPSVLQIVSVSKTDVENCFSDATAHIKITTNGGGTTPYFFSIDNGESFHQNLGNFTNLTAGIYPIQMHDSHDCEAAFSAITISQPPDIQVINSETTLATCFGFSDGTITIEATGGTGNLRYSINDLDYIETGVFDNLSANNYSVFIRDERNCLKTSNLQISEPEKLKIKLQQKTDISCFALTDGKINLQAAGGTAPYYFSIETPQVFDNQTGTFENLIAGSYFPALKDAHACMAYGTALQIIEPNELKIADWLISDAPCFGATGTVEVVATGGTGILSFSSNGGESFMKNSGVFDNLRAGEYFIQIQDANFCTSATSIATVGEADKIEFYPDIQQVSCNGGENGAISIRLAKATEPVSYTWGSGESKNAINNLYSGTYTLSVSDANACTASESFFVNEPDELRIQLSIKNQPCKAEADGELEIEIDGGTAPYETLWQDASLNWLDAVSELPAGRYTAFITDSNDCKSDSYIDLEAKDCPSNVLADYNVFTPDGDGKNDFFQIKLEHVKTFEVQIVNRWGTIIYRTNQADAAWDGTINKTGVEAKNGTYYYIINAVGIDSEPHKIKGIIQLIR